MNPNTPIYNSLVANLRGYHRKQQTVEALRHLLSFLLLAAPVVFLFVLIEAGLQLAPTGRYVSLAILLSLLLALAVRYGGRFVLALWRLFRPDMANVARRVGAYYQNVSDRLVNALQLYENSERDRERFSLELTEAALARMSDALAAEQFSSKVETAALKRSGRNFAVLLLLLAGPWFGFNNFFAGGLVRLTHPAQNYDNVKRVRFAVEPGNVSVIKGEDLPVRAWVSDSTATRLVLHLQNQANVVDVPLVKSKTDSFKYVVTDVRDSLAYSFSLGEQRSPVYTILPLERPLLRTLSVKVEPPAYAKIEPYFLDENIGDISALKGSKIKLTGTANKNLGSGQIEFSDGKKTDLGISGRKIAADFQITRDDQYTIHLFDESGHENVTPITYKISLIPDNYPFVQVVSPGQDIDLGEDMIIPLAIEAQDDYGLSQLRLGYQMLPGGEGDIDSSRFAFSDIKGFNYGDDELRVLLNWDLSQLNMYPTDVLAYFAEVFDNDNVSGPKSSRSKIYRARFPSLYEMYEEMASEQEEATDAFEEALEKGRELQKKLDDLSLDMKRTTEMDWQQKQEVEEALQQQQQIENKIDEISRQMDEMIENIQKNDLFTQDVMKKFEEIQQLYREIMTPELQEAMQKMTDALKNLDEDLVRQAMEQMQLNTEEYNKTLDRTISLLKKLKAEQKLEQAAKMAQDLAQRQENVAKESQQQNADSERLAKQQEQIDRDAQALSDLLQELQQDAKEVPSMPTEQVNNAAAEMQSQSLQQNLQALQQMLAQNQMANVPQNASQAQQSFQRMAENLEAARQMMNGEMQRQAMQAMRKGSRELLQLSKEQEQLMQQTRDLARNSAQYPDMADRQQEIASGLQRVLDEMAQSMKENFGIDPQVSQSLGQSMAAMEQALADMENRNGSQASQNQGASMSGMNAAIRQMQESMQNMQQQGSGGGMSYQQFMQQMQAMADAQGQINQQSQGMGNPGQLSLGQQAAMARLAAEQQQVRKSMEQLAKEAGGMSEVLGSLEKIADDMKKVEQDFANQNITRDTINRQNRILSRMLDAQKSVHQREFSREREAETGKNYIARNPGQLPADLGERENLLQQELLRAKKEGYSRDYLQVIEKYFKALTEHEISKE